MAGSFSTEVRSALLEGGATVTWREAGDGGVPLVLLHGIGSAAESWSAQLAGLSAARRVVAWDAPGYGGTTSLAADAPCAGDYAARLGEFLDRLVIARCHLVGHSLGALMAARFARGAPDRVASLTLASPATGHASHPADERARRLQTRLDDIARLGPRGMAEARGPRLLSPNADQSAIRAVVETMAKVRPIGYAQAAHLLAGGKLLTDVAALEAGMPMQVVVGSADVITPPDLCRRVADARPGTPFHLLPSLGHALHVEGPVVLNRVIGDFIGGHDG